MKTAELQFPLVPDEITFIGELNSALNLYPNYSLNEATALNSYYMTLLQIKKYSYKKCTADQIAQLYLRIRKTKELIYLFNYRIN